MNQGISKENEAYLLRRKNFQVIWILDALSGKLPAIRQLQAEGAEMHINIGIQYAGCGHSIDLSKEVMGVLSSYRIDLEYYFFRIED